MIYVFSFSSCQAFLRRARVCLFPFGTKSLVCIQNGILSVLDCFAVDHSIEEWAGENVAGCRYGLSSTNSQGNSGDRFPLVQ